MELEAKSKTAQLTETLKNNQLVVGAFVLGLLASLYISNGGSVSNAIGYVKHPMDQEARLVNNVMGYTNPAIVKQLQEGRKTLLAGLTTPTYFNVTQWGPANGEKDEFEFAQTLRGEEIEIYGRGIHVDSTQIRLTATLVGRDGCADFQIEHLLNNANHVSKVCLAQGESILIPLKKSDLQLKREEARKREKEKIMRLFGPIPKK